MKEMKPRKTTADKETSNAWATPSIKSDCNHFVWWPSRAANLYQYDKWIRSDNPRQSEVHQPRLWSLPDFPNLPIKHCLEWLHTTWHPGLVRHGLDSGGQQDVPVHIILQREKLPGPEWLGNWWAPIASYSILSWRAQHISEVSASSEDPRETETWPKPVTCHKWNKCVYLWS